MQAHYKGGNMTLNNFFNAQIIITKFLIITKGQMPFVLYVTLTYMKSSSYYWKIL